MKERPILFSAPMVRAILDGSKTQTRRVIKLKTGDTFDERALSAAIQEWRPVYDNVAGKVVAKRPALIRCPYGQPGDRLYVREAWRIGAWDEDQGAFAIDYCDGPRREWLTDPNDHDGSKFEKLWIQCCDELAAKGIPPGPDGHYRWEPGQSPLRWRPSIHMPRWASRITLKITDIRVERLNDISERDCRAEGYPSERDERSNGSQIDPWLWYRSLWESINGPESWALNPWVWVVEFRRIQP